MEKKTQQQRVVDMLRSQEKVSSAEFYEAYLPRFAARIFELKKLGYVIEREYWRDGMYLYRLASEPEPVQMELVAV